MFSTISLSVPWAFVALCFELTVLCLPVLPVLCWSYLCFACRVDRTLPIEETWRALAEVVREGKAKYLGISEASADEIRR